jgi:hypothetical protein
MDRREIMLDSRESKFGEPNITMNTVAEIKAAIKALPPTERERLAEDLLFILPELRGDFAWQRIIADERPRPALAALGDEIDTRYKTPAA